MDQRFQQAPILGELVLFKDITKQGGRRRRTVLGPKWFGPARIVKSLGPVTRIIGEANYYLSLTGPDVPDDPAEVLLVSI